MPTTITFAQAADFLKQHDNYLILTHKRPDGDTIGCAAGLCRALRGLGKTAYILPNEDVIPLLGGYLDGLTAPDGFTPDTVVSTDVATENLLPDSAALYKGRIDLAIDHHPSHEGFAKSAIVRPEAAAAGEIVYDILSALGPITPDMALPLYVAVSTDTGCFVYGNTTAYTHAVAAALMRTGIDFQAVNKTFFRTKTRKRLQLEAAMMDGCEFHDRGRTALLSVPLSLMERVQASAYDAEDLSAFGPQIQGVDCAVTLRELRPDVWKLSLRTGPRVNATRVCALFGGGGHAAAAGCTIEGTLEQVKERLLKGIAQVIPDFLDN